MKKKKNVIDSTEPINNITDVDRMIDAFVERGGYITLNEDLKIRKRIPNRNNLASWIMSVKNKLIYKKEEIIKKISESRVSKKKKKVSKGAPSPIVKPVKEEQNVNVVTKHSLIIDSYSNICKDDSTLRPYQQKAKREIFESWEEVDSVMFQMPTGTGKTRLFTSIINDINKYSIARKEPVRILIIAHRTELIDQIDKSLDRYKVAHNIIAGGNKKDYRKPVNVASIQTLTHPNNLERAKMLNVQFVIIDEAHHALAKTYKKLWDLYPNAKRLGVTATPWRMNHQSFTDLFDKIIISMPVKEFIKEGFLAPYKYFSLKGDSDIQRAIDGIELDRFGEYMESSMEEKMDIGSIRAQLLDSYLALAEGKKGIIYAINIEHANHICEEYKRAGYNAVSIDSKTPAAKRNELVKKFKRGLIDIIVNVDIFSEGFDCPDIEFIQLARPTRSLVKYLQQVGRGLRITENKQHCVILDNVGMYSRFGLPDARRHWKAHFLGKNIDETPTSVGISLGGSGRRREVDMSEGTEDMELIQDDYKDIESMGRSTSAINDFFSLFGVTLGKTTWKDVEDMGYEVNIWKKGPGRYTYINDVAFWDTKGEGIFTSLYWVRTDDEMPPSWKSKGLSWDLSSDEWVDVFKKMGYTNIEKTQPDDENNSNSNVTREQLEIVSPDYNTIFYIYFDREKISNHNIISEYLSSIFIYHRDSGEKNQIEKDADITNETEVEADAPKENEIKKVSAPIDPTKLDRIFDKKASSYIYFWFMAIISLAQEKKNLTISYKDILIRMAAMAWPIIFVDKIDLGAGDMIPKYLNDILKQSPLTDNTPSKVVEAYLKVYYESEGIDKRLSPLLKNVPYRFLSPWIRYTNDEEVIEESNSYDCACLYALHDDHIILNEKWWDYISKHYSKICGSVERSFILHAKQKNRNNRFTHLMATGWSLV